MSGQYSFEDKDQIIDFLETTVFPVCLTLNYDPEEKVYGMDIGNQPYKSYEQIIIEEKQIQKGLRDDMIAARDIVADLMANSLEGIKVDGEDLAKLYKLLK